MLDTTSGQAGRGQGPQPSWFLAQLKPNGLAAALRNLQRQHFRVFCPRLPATRRRNGRLIETWEPLFPGYLFVGFQLATAPWRKINSTLGIARLVQFDSRGPAPVPTDLVEGLQARCDGRQYLLPPEQLAAGDRIRITAGPFAQIVTRIETVDRERRIWVLMDIMGQKARVALRPDQVQKL